MLNFGVSEKKAAQLAKRMAECGLRESDLVESFIRSSGPGGQHVNKTATCVLLKHPPTGFDVKMQKTRSQLMNRFYARRRLCELIEEKELGKLSPESLARQKRHKQKQRRKRRTKARDKTNTP